MAQPLFTERPGDPRAPRPALRSVPARAEEPGRPSPLHVHWFRWSGEDAFSGSSLYTCRCGQVRPGL
ncbi:hypothetical protein [Blastococcus sp. TF02A-35]|uniref:hypothetical protein n=1 Tax=Blastococcus sp. TF02A-35 TaxID=2559612 RepID=UPI0010739917|nr:hypothetical protein [Blastococcus sp. TF02A_35]TFV53693.1 hypothetical protein E4P43_00085 [Blastococcus sp. TF02A_35]